MNIKYPANFLNMELISEIKLREIGKDAIRTVFDYKEQKFNHTVFKIFNEFDCFDSLKTPPTTLGEFFKYYKTNHTDTVRHVIMCIINHFGDNSLHVEYEKEGDAEKYRASVSKNKYIHICFDLDGKFNAKELNRLQTSIHGFYDTLKTMKRDPDETPREFLKRLDDYYLEIEAFFNELSLFDYKIYFTIRPFTNFILIPLNIFQQCEAIKCKNLGYVRLLKYIYKMKFGHKGKEYKSGVPYLAYDICAISKKYLGAKKHIQKYFKQLHESKVISGYHFLKNDVWITI